MRFGISTHLVHGERLERRHVDDIAARGFELIEIFATRTHVDYHDARAIADVRAWLDAAHLEAWSLHAPITEGFVAGGWGRAYSNASPDAAIRQEAVDETRAAIRAAGQLGCSHVVLHLGIPRGQPIPAGDNDAGAVARSIEPIASACQQAGVGLALELIPNDLSTAPALLRWLDSDLDLGPVGACLDTGHAHLTGGAPEAIEQLSGYITTSHVHDNRGTTDDHLVPFDGTLDWPATLMAFAKIGYTGPYILELPAHDDAARTLERAVKARERIRAILKDLEQPFDF